MVNTTKVENEIKGLRKHFNFRTAQGKFNVIV